MKKTGDNGDRNKKIIFIIITILIIIITLRHTIIDQVVGTKDCGRGVHMINCYEGTINVVREIIPYENINIYLTNKSMDEFGGLTIPPDSIIMFDGFENKTIIYQKEGLLHEYFHTQGATTRLLGWKQFGYSFYEEGLAEYTTSIVLNHYSFICGPEGVSWSPETGGPGTVYPYDVDSGMIEIEHYAKAYCLWKNTEYLFGKEKTMGFVNVYHSIVIGSDANIESAYEEYFGVPPLIKPIRETA